MVGQLCHVICLKELMLSGMDTGNVGYLMETLPSSASLATLLVISFLLSCNRQPRSGLYVSDYSSAHLVLKQLTDVRAGILIRIRFPSLFGVAPMSDCMIAFSIAAMAVLS